MQSDAEVLARWYLDQKNRGLRPRTIVARKVHLTAYRNWFSNKSILTATRDDVEGFLASRGTLAPRSRSSWLSHLQCFYRWAVDRELCRENPVDRIQRPKIRRGVPRPAATVELATAVAAADPVTRCWILLAAYAGLRVQEIAGVRREDVLEADGLLRVTEGKGGKERLVPLNPNVLKGLRALPMPTSGYLFRTKIGGRYRPEYLAARFNLKLAELGVNATPHQLRHWFGTNLYRSTQDIRVVQEMMGHDSPATTAIYAMFDPQVARKGVSALSFAGDTG